jgi:hypothetical protein
VNGRFETALTACSICLRVQRGSEWVEAEAVIAETRSYELDAPPRLGPGMCDACADRVLGRRTAAEPLAA